MTEASDASHASGADGRRNDPAADSSAIRLARLAYSLAWLLALPAAAMYLLWRSWRQPEYRRHWGERFGFFGQRRKATRPLLWVHAVSVGETRAAQPLISQLRRLYPDHDLLMTNGTPTGRATNTELFGRKGVMRCYLPYDFPWCVNRFLDHYKPCVAILIEAELWPNLVACSRAHKIPVALVNARLSEKSLAKGLRWQSLIGPAIEGLDCIAAQSENDAQRLSLLGRDDVVVTGNLKFDAPVVHDLIEKGRRWRKRFGKRQVILIASSRDGEEAPILNAWNSHGPRRPLLIVVPRHPERFDEVHALLGESGRPVVRRKDLDTETEVDADFVLGDSMGEMFAYYGAADIVVMGGSLLPFGGQNLIEACASGIPVIVGPHTYNFEEAADQAIRVGAALRADSAQQAIGRALELLSDTQRLAQMAQAAEQFARDHTGATQLTLKVLAPYLER